jgi:hypothetical protein
MVGFKPLILASEDESTNVYSTTVAHSVLKLFFPFVYWCRVIVGFKPLISVSEDECTIVYAAIVGHSVIKLFFSSSHGVE